MKTRNDYVSNSSSSSFICLLEDNQYGVLLEDFKLLTLKQYIKEFGYREIFDYYYEKLTPSFVESLKYSRMFKDLNVAVLPLTAKEAYEDYEKFKNANNGKFKYGSDEFVKYCEALDKLKARILDKCLEALELDWGNQQFCYQEIDDNELSNECFDTNSREDLMQEKWDYVNSLKPLKFRRQFSNH